MADRTITLDVSRLHDIVGSVFMLGCDVPLELATSTLLHAAEELTVLSLAMQKPASKCAQRRVCDRAARESNGEPLR